MPRYYSAKSNNVPQALDYYKQMFMPNDTQPVIGIPLGLVHGDVWTNNMLFK